MRPPPAAVSTAGHHCIMPISTSLATATATLLPSVQQNPAGAPALSSALLAVTVHHRQQKQIRLPGTPWEEHSLLPAFPYSTGGKMLHHRPLTPSLFALTASQTGTGLPHTADTPPTASAPAPHRSPPATRTHSPGTQRTQPSHYNPTTIRPQMHPAYPFRPTRMHPPQHSPLYPSTTARQPAINQTAKRLLHGSG